MRADSPSDTALLVARSILLASKDEALAKLTAPEEVSILRKILKEAGRAAWFDFVLDHGWSRNLLRWMERAALPGIIAHYLVRKRRIEVAVREAIAQGISQVVVLGAGFDTLAWRLYAENREVVFVELDHPATQLVKRQALGTAANFQLGAVDLSSEPLSVGLRGCPAYSGTSPTVFIVEGLTMYLAGERVRALMMECAGLAGPSGMVVFTFMEADADGEISFRGAHPLIDRWLQWRSEPFQWGISQGDLPGFLESCGLQLRAVIDEELLREQILAPRELGEILLARGECICLCDPLIR